MALCSLALTCALAFAQVKPACKKPTPPVPPPPTPVTGTNTNTNTNINTNTQTQSQNQSQSQTANGGSASSTSSATGGNATGGNVSIVDKYERQAPSIGLGGFIVPTFGCGGSVQAGASAPIGSLMFGKSTQDKECNFVRLANEFIAMGNFEAAAKMLCATKSAKEAKLTLDDCRLTVKPVPAPALPIPDVHDMSNFPEPVPAPAITVNIPLTVVNPAPELKTAPVVHKAQPKVACKITKHTADTTTRVCKPCPEK
jgi:hypothetical protein